MTRIEGEQRLNLNMSLIDQAGVTGDTSKDRKAGQRQDQGVAKRRVRFAGRCKAYVSHAGASDQLLSTAYAVPTFELIDVLWVL